MTGRLAGKVALVTGAGRGQGRSHAIRMAQEGADVIAVDICADIASNGYPLASAADLKETAAQVEALDRRVVAEIADVRDVAGLGAAVAEGVAQLGRLDIVVANAGIAAVGPDRPVQAYLDTVAVNYTGVLNTIEAALPHLGDGSSIICTGSTAALLPVGTRNPSLGPGGVGYSTAKRNLARMVHEMAALLASRRIRVNAVHPYNTNTDMLHSRPMRRVFRPDLDDPAMEDVEPALLRGSPMGVPWIEPSDVSEAVVFLAADESRYLTGTQLRIDGGHMLPLMSPGVPD